MITNTLFLLSLLVVFLGALYIALQFIQLHLNLKRLEKKASQILKPFATEVGIATKANPKA